MKSSEEIVKMIDEILSIDKATRRSAISAVRSNHDAGIWVEAENSILKTLRDWIEPDQSFESFLESASAEVKEWPAWKQGMLGGTAPERSPREIKYTNNRPKWMKDLSEEDYEMLAETPNTGSIPEAPADHLSQMRSMRGEAITEADLLTEDQVQTYRQLRLENKALSLANEIRRTPPTPSRLRRVLNRILHYLKQAILLPICCLLSFIIMAVIYSIGADKLDPPDKDIGGQDD